MINEQNKWKTFLFFKNIKIKISLLDNILNFCFCCCFSFPHSGELYQIIELEASNCLVFELLEILFVFIVFVLVM